MRGTLISGRYLLETALGSGATGTVFRARDQRTGGEVAVKLLHLGFARDETYSRRFRREAQTAAAITSPRVVRIYDQGTHDGAAYIVMELITGETLAAHLQRRGVLPLPEALGVVLEITRAAEAADRAGVVHRDLKPQNVILTEGQVKVLDFGIARSASDLTLTVTGQYLGSPAYSAPERLTSAGDIRVDIYAIGVMLYELLAGAPPFTAETAQALLQRHATTSPPPLPAMVPEPVARVVQRCLLKDPDERYATPSDLAQALEDALRRLALAPAIPWPAPDQPAPARTADDPTIRLVATRAPSNLPRQVNRFIGRGAERRAAHRLLAGVRLLTITGVAGAGKTRLALQIAKEARTAFPDGVWLVELAALSDPELVAQTVAAVLGVRPPPEQPAVDALVDHLSAKRLLLVLDNCEHLGAGPRDLAARLVPSCPGIKLLATSRELLGFPGEASHLIRSLDSPPAITDDLAAHDATALFLERTGLRPTAAGAAAVHAICRQLNGMPLAIELVAARVAGASVTAVATALAERVRALTGRPDEVIPRDRVLETVLDWSYDTLPPTEQTLLRRFSVFAGGATAAAAAAICGETGERAQTMAARLRALVALGLMQRIATAAGPRFRLLEPVRQYAGRRLVSAGEAAATQRRHRDWYLTFSDSLNNGLFRHRQALWLKRGEVEHDNLRAAIAWCAGDPAEAEAGMTLAANTRPFWSFRGYQAEGRRRLSAATEHSDGTASVPRARAYIGLGMLAMDQGDFSDSVEALEQGVATAKATGQDWWIGIALMQLGNVYGSQGDFALARPLWEECLTTQRRANNEQGIANVLGNLAIIAAKEGNFVLAREQTTEALAIVTKAGDVLRAAALETNLAAVETTLGGYPSARERYDRIVKIYEAVGDEVDLVSALLELGASYQLQMDFSDAEQQYRKALRLLDGLENKADFAAVHQRLGALALDTGNLAAAREHLERAVPIAIQERILEPLARARADLARLALVEGAPHQAFKEYAEALTLNQEIGDLLGIIGCLDGFAAVAAAQHQPQRAATLLAAAQALRDERQIQIAPLDQQSRNATAAGVRAVLSAGALAAAEQVGAALDRDTAATYAREG